MEQVREKYIREIESFGTNKKAIETSIRESKSYVQYATSPVFIVNNKQYDNYEEAMKDATSGDQITVVSRYTLDGEEKLILARDSIVNLEIKLTELVNDHTNKINELEKTVVNVLKPIYLIYGNLTCNQSRHSHYSRIIGSYSSISLALMNLPKDVLCHGYSSHGKKHWIQIDFDNKGNVLDCPPQEFNYDSD